MARSKRIRWRYYVVRMFCENGKCTFSAEDVGHTSLVWPNFHFESFAAKRGFTKFVRDTTLIGGYYNNDKAESLIVWPEGSDPLKAFQ